MALISRQPRSATVTAIQRSRLLPLSRKLLLDRMGQAPEIALHLLKTLIKRIHRADRLMNEMPERSAGAGSMAGEAVRADAGGDTGGCTASSEPPGDMDEDAAAADLSMEQMAAVWEVAARTLQVEPGDYIFREGDPGDAMYVILDGRVEISRSLDGVPTVLAMLGPRDLLGELALITGDVRSAAAKALDASRLVQVQAAAFANRIRQEPRLAVFLLECLILRLHQKERACRSAAGAARQFRKSLMPLLKQSDRPKVALVSLSTCGGCTSVFLEDRKAYSSILAKADVVYFPMLIDEETIREADVTLVDGGVRITEDAEKLIEARRKSRWLVAFGTCATFGGIPSLANRYELEELIQASYGDSRDLFAYYLDARSGVCRDTFQQDDLRLTRRFWKVSDHVRIDYYLPGCPPSALLFEQLLCELRGERLAKSRPLVCVECGRKVIRPPGSQTQVPDIIIPDPKICLQSQGLCCMGSLTRGGCGASCPSTGTTCWGCRGPSRKVLQKLNDGESLAGLLVDRMMRLCQMDRDSATRSVRRFMVEGHAAINENSAFAVEGARIR